MRLRLLDNTHMHGLLAVTPLAGLVSALCAPAVFAQDAGETEEIIYVTGTRIPQPDFEFSNPVVSVDAATIQRGGATNLVDFIQDVPALVNSYDLEDGADTEVPQTSGLNLLNLRNLGTDRTLVLVNGRRHVGGDPGSAAVDINSIPVDLIERVDVLTGGASALYGADGVSGVVNFVLKDDFDGISTRLQFGMPNQDGGENTFVSVLGGHNFAGDRGNVTVSLEHLSSDPVNRDDRDYTRLGQRQILTGNPADLENGIDDPDIVDNIFSTDVRYVDSSPGGSLYTDIDYGELFGGFQPLAGIDFTGDGDPFEVGTYSGEVYMIGGDGSLRDQFVDQLLPGLDRTSLNTTFRFDISPLHSVFAEAKWTQTETDFIAQPTFDIPKAQFGFVSFPIDLDNAYAPEAAVIDALDPDDGQFFIDVLRDHLDLGPLTHKLERETTRFVVGLEGELPVDGWQYEVSYGWGKTREDHTTRNNRVEDRWLAATDAVFDPDGNIVCRSDLDPDAWPLFYFFEDPDDPILVPFGTTFTPGPGSGCVPADIFGEDISPEARAWMTTTSFSPAEIRQEVFNGFITGDTGSFRLPGGPIGFAVGIELREEESESYASADALLSAELGADVTWLGQGSNTIGKFDVEEYFGEISFPLLADRTMARELTIDAAFRKSDYSTAGNTDTYKAGFLWRPIEMVMFRSTRARAVRAPNIAELFLPSSQTFAQFDDPCDFDKVDAGSEYRYDNCAADLGFDPYDYFNFQTASVEGRLSGNVNLLPEKADTVTYGVVLNPTDGLTFAIDYFEIEIDDAINFFSAQNILDYCYDLPRPNQYCSSIERDPDFGVPVYFEEFGVNVAEYNTKGYDYTLRYQGPELDIGQFQLSMIATRLDELAYIEIPEIEPDSQVGEPGSPEYQAVLDLTWFRENWTVNYGFSWFDETNRFTAEELAADPDYIDPQYFMYSAREVHDIYARYDLGNGLSFFGGINNLTDQEPDIGSYNYPVNPVGRYTYFGVNFNMN